MLSLGLADVALFAWYIGVLVLLEGLLSADNALVLAVMVRHLPKDQQRRVLFWGIWGAVGFRVLALMLSSILLKFWYCKVLGGVYLLYLASRHFVRHQRLIDRSRRGSHGEIRGLVAQFLGDGDLDHDGGHRLLDRLDSRRRGHGRRLPGRFGDRGKFSIVFLGGVLGIITMRFVVRYFLILLERFPGLDEGAYYLVAWIGLKLLISGFHQGHLLGFHIPEPLFWSVMLLIAGVSLVVKPRPKSHETERAASLDLLDRAQRGPDETLQNAAENPAGTKVPSPRE